MKMIFFWFQNRFEIIQQLKKKKTKTWYIKRNGYL